MSIFILGFWILVVIAAIIFLYTYTAVPGLSDVGFKQFQKTYLLVYLLAMAGDWLQGPYVYALYDHYGMAVSDIELLFVAGFGSSMIFGTFVGSFADKYGRRANCILYCILYGMSCVTKHFNNFGILMIGRLLGGIATSILYSAFESWLVCEHNKRGYDPDALSGIFSHAIVGNSIVAIGCGVVAQQFADIFGFVAPFDISLFIMICLMVILIFTWSENYGDTSSSSIQSLVTAVKCVRSDYKILCLGVIQSLFEGSMYMFVLEWTPALAIDNEKIPHGYIFASFMISCMIGSSLFKVLCKHFSAESLMRSIFLLSSAALSVPIFLPKNQLAIFICFLVFEMCVGVFWPAIMTMRSRYVPESIRATVMNVFRIPLNLIVVIILIQNLQLVTIFKFCSGFLLLAASFQHWLHRLTLCLKNNLPPSPEGPVGPIESLQKEKIPPVPSTDETKMNT